MRAGSRTWARLLGRVRGEASRLQTQINGLTIYDHTTFGGRIGCALRNWSIVKVVFSRAEFGVGSANAEGWSAALIAAPYQQPKNAKANASATSTSSTSAKLIDINTASQDELKALPGIGDAYSAAIIKNRPCANKRQLVSRMVIPHATYDKIADRVVGEQGK
jgi:competence protein ComEA